MATEAAGTPAPQPRASAPPAQARERVPIRGLHLGVLYALAVSQPLLNLLGNNADFFTSRQLTSGKVLWLVRVFGLGFPLVLYVVALVGVLIRERIGWIVDAVVVFGLFLLFTVQ